MRASLKEILNDAKKRKYAVPAFNISNLEIARAVTQAANDLKAPVILQTSEGGIAYGGMHHLGAIARICALTSKYPVIFHLDHGKDEKIVIQAIKSGWYDSVMIDASQLSFEKNVALTQKIVTLAHNENIDVEAELGTIAGKEDVIQAKKSNYTDPAQAEFFVNHTHCDALAISIGTAHGIHKSNNTVKLDIKRLTEISSRISIPLVLHGASTVPSSLVKKFHQNCKKLNDCARVALPKGVPTLQITKAIQKGITKINIDTDIRLAFSSALRESLLTNTHTFDPRELLAGAQEAVYEHAKEIITLCKAQQKG